jgi:hypothetical protein
MITDDPQQRTESQQRPARRSDALLVWAGATGLSLILSIVAVAMNTTAVGHGGESLQVAQSIAKLEDYQVIFSVVGFVALMVYLFRHRW